MGGAGKVRVEVVSCAHLIAYCGGGFRVFKGFFFKRFASEYPARRKSNPSGSVCDPESCLVIPTSLGAFKMESKAFSPGAVLNARRESTLRRRSVAILAGRAMCGRLGAESCCA